MALEPYKIVAQVVAQEKDDDGNTIGEPVVATLTLYRHQFGELEQRIEEAWPDVQRAHAPTLASVSNGSPA